MSVLARKIAPAKWEVVSSLGASAIAADAVTADLRTTGNTLSFWRCESSSVEDLKRAALALAAASERPDRLQLVFIDEQAVLAAGLSTSNTVGDTPIESLRQHHVDVERLDLIQLGDVAGLVAAAHRASASHGVSKKDVVGLVAQAVRDGLVALSSLKEKMKDSVEAHLNDSPPK